MSKELNFAWYAIKTNLKGHAELRASFLTNIVGMALNNTAFVILWVFFARSVGPIGGWQAADVVGLLGFGALSYGLVFTVGMGLRKLPDYVASGIFDRFMLSPKNLLLRTATSSLNTSAIGDMIFGIACLAIYGSLINAGWQQIGLMVALVILAATIFFAGTVIIFSTSFLFTDANAVASSLFELFLTPSLFHGGAFQGAIRFVFTFIIPSLLVGTVPVEAVKDVLFSKLWLVATLAAVWLLLSFAVFNKAVRKYESANFITFGG